VGFLPGISTPGGATHQAIDDVALMRILPNMTVLECGDATDVESVLDVAQGVPGPVYIRMLRGEVPRLFDPHVPLELGRARVLSEGTDVALLSSGICTEEAMRATEAMQDQGVSVCHLHISTLKPFQDASVLDAIEAVGLGVITVENHTVVGGLGSAVAEWMAETASAKPLIRLGLQDQYAHGASRPYLMQKYGLDAAAIVRAAERLTGATVRLRNVERGAHPKPESRQHVKAEDL
jgi:transketolase